MITKVVKLRSLCTRDKFQYHLNLFINKVYHSTRYAMIEVKFIKETGENIVLGKGYYIDLNSEIEIRSYKYYLSQFYSYQVNLDEVKQIVFTFVSCDKKTYSEQINKVREEKS